MADLSDVYGNNFQSQSQKSKIDHIISIIVTNISHRQFKFRMYDSDDLWKGSGYDLEKNIIDSIITKTQNLNNHLTVVHLHKNTEQINMLPELIIDVPVEYFMIIDEEYNKAYFIYLTPYEVNSY
jgi:hypothetical protein